MIRYIKIEDSKKRDAEITFKSINSKASIYLAIETGEKPENKKVIKYCFKIKYYLNKVKFKLILI